MSKPNSSPKQDRAGGQCPAHIEENARRNYTTLLLRQFQNEFKFPVPSQISTNAETIWHRYLYLFGWLAISFAAFCLEIRFIFQFLLAIIAECR